MDFHSVKTSSAAWPASRWPLPVSFVPPNGRCTSAPIVPALTYVMPASRSRIARKAALTSCVKVEDGHRDERGRRAEDLLLRDPHLRVDVGEDGRPVEEALAQVAVAGDLAAG